MTPEERLEERLMLCIDLGCLINRTDNLLIVTYNRKLDTNLTYLKHWNKAKFTRFLDQVAEAYTKYNFVK